MIRNQEEINTLPLPIEYFYLLIEMVISCGVRGIIFPLMLTCKELRGLVLNNLLNIMDKYTTFVDVPETIKPKGIYNPIPCKLKDKYYQIADRKHGTRHIEFTFENSYILSETLIEHYWIGKLQNFTTYIKEFEMGQFWCLHKLYQNGIGNGVSLRDIGKNNEVSVRTVSMITDGVESCLHFNVRFDKIGTVKAIGLESKGRYVNKLLNISYLNNYDEAYPSCLSELNEDIYPPEFPLLDDLYAWHNFYFKLKNIFEEEYPSFIGGTDMVDRSSC
jgi:hypothetical protein